MEPKGHLRREGESLMDPWIEFTVFGKPRPQGSKRHVGRGIMIESSKYLKPWRQEVSLAAIALQAPMFGPHVPVELTLNFYFSKPKSAKRKAMTTKPDTSKLLRAIEDSLTGILFYDDSQIVETHIRKHYGGPERVEIRVEEAVCDVPSAYQRAKRDSDPFRSDSRFEVEAL